MTRVLVVGHVPLPFENLQKSYAPGARTWQLAGPLVDAGHEVSIAGIRIPFVYPDDMPPVVEHTERGCRICSMTMAEAEAGKAIRRMVDEFEPECVVGSCAYPSYVAASVWTELPMWADIYGCQLAEGQLKAHVYRDDNFLVHFRRINYAVVIRADRFSTVGTRQKYELIGELAFAGRLTSSTTGYDFVSEMPSSYADEDIPPEGASALRQRAPGDFLVLWSGGYNTWTDTRTLFEGLSYAMDRNPRIKFVSTGGSIDGHDELTYPTLVSMVRGSPHRDRFLLEGWLDRQTARSYYFACNVGINIDAETYEVMFGSRTRLIDWAVAGLPALSTDLCELTEELSARGLLFTFPARDPVALGTRLLELAAEEEELKETGGRLREYVLDRFSPQATTAALLDWVAHPSHSPDWDQRKDELRPPPPPITPDSSAAAKLRFYLKNEGLSSTVRRARDFTRKKPDD